MNSLDLNYNPGDSRQKPTIVQLPIGGTVLKHDAWTYNLPIRAFNPQKNEIEVIGYQPLDFLRGAKNNLFIDRKAGIFIEDLYVVMIDRLTTVNQIVPSEKTKAQINFLQQAYDLCVARSEERVEAGVKDTYEQIPNTENNS